MRLLCAWCPDTEVVWSRFLDMHICPDCRGDQFVELDNEPEGSHLPMVPRRDTTGGGGSPLGGIQGVPTMQGETK
jgi:hypothetical protein